MKRLFLLVFIIAIFDMQPMNVGASESEDEEEKEEGVYRDERQVREIMWQPQIIRLNQQPERLFLSPNGYLLGVLCMDNSIVLYDMREINRLVQKIEDFINKVAVNKVVFSFDGKGILVENEEGGRYYCFVGMVDRGEESDKEEYRTDPFCDQEHCLFYKGFKPTHKFARDFGERLVRKSSNQLHVAHILSGCNVLEVVAVAEFAEVPESPLFAGLFAYYAHHLDKLYINVLKMNRRLEHRVSQYVQEINDDESDSAHISEHLLDWRSSLLEINAGVEEEISELNRQLRVREALVGQAEDALQAEREQTRFFKSFASVGFLCTSILTSVVAYEKIPAFKTFVNRCFDKIFAKKEKAKKRSDSYE